MPLTTEMLATLKRTNASIDAEKSKQRVKADFTSSKNRQKTAVVELSGLTRASIYRVFREGAVSAKIAIAMAQILNVSPFYYTGESDEKGECTDAVLYSFLVQKGFRSLANQIAQQPNSDDSKAMYAEGTSGIFSSSVPTPLTNPLFTSAFSNSPELATAAIELPLEEAHQLLTALYVRAKAGGNAKQIADLVKRCLLI